MKKLIMLLIISIGLLCNFEPAYAKEVTYIEYKVTADNTGNSDATINIQHYLNIARHNATDNVRYKIIVPKGVYKLTKNLNIFSNTWLYLEEGATMIRCFSKGAMLKNGEAGTEYYGYDSFRNIRLEGGTWDGYCFDEKYGYDNCTSFSTMRFGHASNIEIENVKVINNKGGHHIEFGGVDGLTVRNCRFSGYLEDYKPDGSYIGKEVIQLDVLHSENVFLGYESFDDTTVNNVLIENNEFIDVSRGIGSHSAVIGRYYKDIVIRNNTFRNLTQQAIIAYNFKNCEITDNVMESVGIGIDFRYMNSAGANFFMPNDITEEIVINNDANTIIKNNTIKSVQTPRVNSANGILLYGYDIKEGNVNENNVKLYNYKVENVTIENNDIVSEGFCMYLNNADKCSIKNNKMAYKNSSKKQSAIFLTNVSCNNYISNNTITESQNGGIYVGTLSNKNVIKYNKISNMPSVGIKIFDKSCSNTVQNNTVFNTYNAVAVDNYSSAVIKNNTIYKNDNFGITSRENSYVIIEGNKVYSNKSHGIDVRKSSRSNKINKNNIYSNNLNGVYVTELTNTQIISNVIKNNNYYGIGLGPNSNRVKVKSNSLTNNKNRAINDSENVSKRLATIKIAYNKGYKIMATGNNKKKIYLKYGERNVLNKITTAKGVATFNFVKSYKNKKIRLYSKDSYGNVSYVDIVVKG